MSFYCNQHGHRIRRCIDQLTTLITCTVYVEKLEKIILSSCAGADDVVVVFFAAAFFLQEFVRPFLSLDTGSQNSGFCMNTLGGLLLQSSRLLFGALGFAVFLCLLGIGRDIAVTVYNSSALLWRNWHA